ncbi:HAD family hydrolase [Enterococcus saccharolyticus]|uniref:HAD family hydrolase n=1 Tax=Candidatus Enterococcus willemsii TaxID=1857215 RepID=A0ABQ6Z0F2_9ENTE|nr:MULTISPECIES: HAD family hydrolase [Enterococcus]KAF1304452.1 HAD family hydrolase [Enterococcus sp. CU12B]MCD5002175.1 HAD family hydrolase [Enterococcus saccharolyticus]
MENTRKLFAFDIDGTLLDSNKQALPSTKKALAKLREAGHIVMIATGRSRYLANTVIQELGFDHYVLCNGSAAFLNHQQIYQKLLPNEELVSFLEEAHQLQIDTSFIGLDASKRSTTFNPERMEEAMQSFGSTTPDLDPDFLDKEDVYQALAFYDESYEGAFDEKYPALSFVRWHEKCVDVIPKGGSKAATILEVANHLGMNQTDVISFGDGMNDREMLEASGTGIAMGNAPEEVRRYANWVTEDNNNDGIWHALVRMGFLEE